MRIPPTPAWESLKSDHRKIGGRRVPFPMLTNLGPYCVTAPTRLPSVRTSPNQQEQQPAKLLQYAQVYTPMNASAHLHYHFRTKSLIWHVNWQTSVFIGSPSDTTRMIRWLPPTKTQVSLLFSSVLCHRLPAPTFNKLRSVSRHTHLR